MILTEKNRQMHIISTDRYGTMYIKNFFIQPEEKGWNISVQRFTNEDPRIKTKHLKHIERVEK